MPISSIHVTNISIIYQANKFFEEIYAFRCYKKIHIRFLI